MSELMLAILVMALWIPILALLRRVIRLEGRLALPEAPIKTPEPVPAVEVVASAPEVTKLERLERGEALTVAPGVQLSLAESSEEEGDGPLPASSTRWVAETALQLLPDLREVTGDRKVSLTFSEETMRGLQSRPLDLLPREGGWRLAAQITQQKFLCDVDDKLKDISSTLDEIRQWLRDEELGVLFGSVRHLKSWQRVLQESELDPVDLPGLLAQIEDANRECFRIQTKAILRLQRAISRLRAQRSERMTVDEALSQVHGVLRDTQNDFYVALLSTRIRTLGTTLRAWLPATRGLTDMRALELQEEIEGIRQASDEIAKALQEPRPLEGFSEFLKGLAQRRYAEEVARLLPRFDGEYDRLIASAEAQVAQLRAGLDEMDQLFQKPLTVGINLSQVLGTAA